MTTPLFANQQEKDALYALLQLLDITKVTVEFSGSGDSGQIDDIQAKNHLGTSINIGAHDDSVKEGDPLFTYQDTRGEWVQDKGYVEKTTQHTTTLYTYFDTLASRAADISGVDWYNNDGGCGTFEIDLSGPEVEVKLEMGQNRTEVDYTHYTLDGIVLEEE